MGMGRRGRGDGAVPIIMGQWGGETIISSPYYELLTNEKEMVNAVVLGLAECDDSSKGFAFDATDVQFVVVWTRQSQFFIDLY